MPPLAALALLLADAPPVPTGPPWDRFGYTNLVSRYGAVGDGVTDDTPAFQKAAADKAHRLYLPPGTYRVIDTVTFGPKRWHVQGAGTGRTVIRLAERSTGFGDTQKPRTVVSTFGAFLDPKAAMGSAFRASLFDLTIDTGAGNPGAVALHYPPNNQGTVSSVPLRSGDMKSEGSAAFVTVLDAQSSGGDPSAAAFENVEGSLLLRNVSASGYGRVAESTVLGERRAAVGPRVGEWLSHPVLTLRPGGRGATLGLRIEDAPFPATPPADGWADVRAFDAAPIAGESVPDAGPGVQTLDSTSGRELGRFPAFEESFRGGVFVSAADFDGDGFADIVSSPDEGGGPRVRVRGGRHGATLADFFAIDDPDFRGGARTAAGDLNGDGTPDLVVAAGFGGGPRVAAFDGRSLRPGVTPVKLFGDRFAFEPELRNGAYVALGDLNADGRADLVAGGGPGGGPRVTVTSGWGGPTLANFFAGEPGDRNGVRVAVGSAADGGVRVLTSGPGATVLAFDASGRTATAPGVGAAGEFVAGMASDPEPPRTNTPQIFQDAEWSYYIPSGIVAGRTYPVLFAFAPAATRPPSTPRCGHSPSGTSG